MKKRSTRGHRPLAAVTNEPCSAVTSSLLLFISDALNPRCRTDDVPDTRKSNWKVIPNGTSRLHSTKERKEAGPVRIERMQSEPCDKKRNGKRSVQRMCGWWKRFLGVGGGLLTFSVARRRALNCAKSSCRRIVLADLSLTLQLHWEILLLTTRGQRRKLDATTITF